MSSPNLVLKKNGVVIQTFSPAMATAVPVATASQPQPATRRPLPLFRFAWYADLDNQLQELADLAMPESWNYKTTRSQHQNPILYNYIQHTFERLWKEHKIEYSRVREHCVFNTGLVTPNHEAIYELFQRNRVPNPSKWYFVKHAKESDRDLTWRFAELPEQANYFERPSDLIYDANLPVRKSIDHIIDDNLDRFPQEFQAADKKHLLEIALGGAIDNAVKRTKQNYKTAIPQFYGGKLQLLLPLCLRDRNKADLALVIERCNDHYRASTVLTLDMAFNNARLIARPDEHWLTP